jgi:hypothetical protein
MKLLTTAALFLVCVLFVGCASLPSGPANRTNVPDVERRVNAALPIGSTREEIESWLTAQGIQYSYSDRPYPKATTEVVGVCEDPTGSITGIIRNTDQSLLVTGNIQLRFNLGKDGRLTQRWVKWVGTGP